MTYLVVTCPHCHAIYKLQRVWTPPESSNDGVTYCPNCGQFGCEVAQLNPEDTWLEVMAQHYHKTTEEMAIYVRLYETLLRQGSKTSLHEMITGSPA